MGGVTGGRGGVVGEVVNTAHSRYKRVYIFNHCTCGWQCDIRKLKSIPSFSNVFLFKDYIGMKLYQTGYISKVVYLKVDVHDSIFCIISNSKLLKSEQYSEYMIKIKKIAELQNLMINYNMVLYIQNATYNHQCFIEISII